MSPRVLTRLAVASVVLSVVVVTLAPRAGLLLVVEDVGGGTSSDATLVTYSVNSFARPLARQAALSAAADRFVEGEGPHVLISPYRSQDEEFRTQSTLAARYLLRRGVTADAIEVLPDVGSEYEEGQAVRAAVMGRGWRRLAVLATDFRSRRTAGTLRRALSGSEVEVLMLSIPDPAVDLQHWWRTREGTVAVAGEYVRLVYYAVTRRL